MRDAGGEFKEEEEPREALDAAATEGLTPTPPRPYGLCEEG